MKAKIALGLIAAAGAAASANAGERVRHAVDAGEMVKKIDRPVKKFYFNAVTGERIIYTDSMPAGRIATEDQWLNLESDPCADGGFYSDVSDPAGIAPFPEVELAPAVGMLGDIPFDTLVDQIEISFTTEYAGATTVGNNLVVAFAEGDDGFGDTVAQPLVAIGVTDLPGAGTDTIAFFTGTVDIGEGIEFGDTDGNPVTRDINGEIADPSMVFTAGGTVATLDRDPVFFGPGNGPGDGALDFGARFWFEQPGVTLGDASTYGNIVNQGMILAGPGQLDSGDGNGFNDCGGTITGNFALPGSLALYDATDFYGFDGGASGTGGADPLAPFAANYDITLFFGGSCCFPGTDPADPEVARQPFAAYVLGLRGPFQFDYMTGGGNPCPANLVQEDPPVLNIDDVLAFLNAFAAGDPIANFVQEDPQVLNIDDVLAFLNAFAAGCP